MDSKVTPKAAQSHPHISLHAKKVKWLARQINKREKMVIKVGVNYHEKILQRTNLQL